MKRSALGGIVLALAGIAVGLYLDGGKLAQLLQPTAALIVFGGTVGAVLIQFPLPAVAQAFLLLRAIFFGVPDEAAQRISDLSRLASRASSVAMMLIERAHFDPQRLSIAGYGEYRPVSSNASAEGRQANRRVDIVIVTTTKPFN